MKKILITGATGFIGSHLTELCVEKGFKVVAFDRYNPNNNLGHLENSKFKNDINFIFGDIRDTEKLSKILPNYDTVIWLAAIVGDGACTLNPLLTKETRRKRSKK